MTSHPKHELKIVDSFDDDPVDGSSDMISLTPVARPGSTESSPKAPSNAEQAKRQMALEIDRLKRLNGVPRLALETCEDDQQ
jgi:hypothetical protein